MSTNESKPSYKLIKYDGENEKYTGKMVREYQDGSLRDSNGHFVEKHPQAVDITSEKASDYVRLRVEKYRQKAAARLAVQLGSYIPDVYTPEDAYAALVAKTGDAIIDNDEPRGRDLAYIGQAIGAIPSQYDRDNTDHSTKQAIDATFDGLRGLLQDIMRAREHIIDADIVE